MRIETICDNVKKGIFSNPSCKQEVVFGPVPSRRLGHSLGINNIQFKTCSYNCVYCQVGRTTRLSVCREACLDPHELFCVAKRKVDSLKEQGVEVDYISFTPQGEPTLDLRLSTHIRLLREFGYKVAVFTNSSLLWNNTVQEDLLFADYVSVKIDTVREETWHTLNRPHRRLRFDVVLDGLADFSNAYRGVLTTETMLVRNMNDTAEELKALAEYLNDVRRAKSYFSIPVRPPAEPFALAPDPCSLSEISSLVSTEIPNSVLLSLPEELDFEGTGDTEEALLGILSVHPMNEQAVRQFLRHRGSRLNTIQEMIRRKTIRKVRFNGKTFYQRERADRH